MAVEQGRVSGGGDVLRHIVRQPGTAGEPPQPELRPREQQQQQRRKRQRLRELLRQSQSPRPTPDQWPEAETKAELRRVTRSGNVAGSSHLVVAADVVVVRRRSVGAEVLALPVGQDAAVAGRTDGAEDAVQRLRSAVQVGAAAAGVPAGEQPDFLEQTALEFSSKGC